MIWYIGIVLVILGSFMIGYCVGADAEVAQQRKRERGR